MGDFLWNAPMKMHSVLAFGSCVAAVLAATAASATTYDPAADYSLASNPNGVYSYGYESTLGGSFTLFSTATDLGGGSGRWNTPTIDQFLGVYKISSLNSILQHPGPSGQDSILRLTAPVAGIYTVSGAFSNGDSATTDVHILVNNVSVFDGAIDYASALDSSAFSFATPLLAGETLDFAVGYGSNGDYYHDSTLLSATVTTGVPEPMTWTLMLTGIFGLGATLRRRRTAHQAG